MTFDPPSLAADRAAVAGGAAAPGALRPRRRRYFTGDARRPFRVCRFPSPVAPVTDPPACRSCGAALSFVRAIGRDGRLGLWRHTPLRRRVLIGTTGPVR